MRKTANSFGGAAFQSLNIFKSNCSVFCSKVSIETFPAVTHHPFKKLSVFASNQNSEIPEGRRSASSFSSCRHLCRQISVSTKLIRLNEMWIETFALRSRGLSRNIMYFQTCIWVLIVRIFQIISGFVKKPSSDSKFYVTGGFIFLIELSVEPSALVEVYSTEKPFTMAIGSDTW